MKKSRIAILLALSLGISSAFTGCGASSKGSISAAVDQAGEDMQEETAPEESQSADQAGVGKIPSVATANLTEEEAANPVPDQFHVELEEVSRVHGKDHYRIHDQSLQKIEGDNNIFCDFSGTPVDPRPAYNAEYLGWNLFSVTLTSESDINCTGLVDAAGNVLIPFDAAVIEFPSFHPKEERPRYVLVYTGTEVTSDEDEALFSAWKSMFASVTTDERVFYKGTLRVFDLVTEQYVPGLEFTSADSYDFAQVGDNLFTDTGNKAVVYSPDGEVVRTEQGNLRCNYRYMLESDNGQYTIMDANGTPLYETGSYTSDLDYDSRNFRTSVNSMYGVIDCRGEILLPAKYDFITGESGNRFIIYNGNSKYTLVAQDGSVITSGTYISDTAPYGFLTYGKSKDYTLITPGNRIVKGLDSSSEYLLYKKKDPEAYLVLNTGEFVSIDGTYCYGVGTGVLKLRNSENKYKLVDVFTGNDLSGFDYDYASSLNKDYLYAEEGDDIVIYTPVVVPEG